MLNPPWIHMVQWAIEGHQVCSSYMKWALALPVCELQTDFRNLCVYSWAILPHEQHCPCGLRVSCIKKGKYSVRLFKLSSVFSTIWMYWATKFSPDTKIYNSHSLEIMFIHCRSPITENKLSDILLSFSSIDFANCLCYGDRQSFCLWRTPGLCAETVKPSRKMNTQFYNSKRKKNCTELDFPTQNICSINVYRCCCPPSDRPLDILPLEMEKCLACRGGSWKRLEKYHRHLTQAVWNTAMKGLSNKPDWTISKILSKDGFSPV